MNGSSRQQHRHIAWLAGIAAAALCGCRPSDEGTAPAAATHAHADHTHAAVPEHAAHSHDAEPRRDAAADASLALLDVDGIDHGTLAAPARGRFTGLFFVRTDCPIANQYAPEIKRVCAAYAADGLTCLLVYVDGHLTADDVRAHVADFDLGLPAMLDGEHALVARAGATVTPEAAIFTPGGELAYRGRIDDFYAELGRPRRQVTEPDLRNALDDLVAGRPVRAGWAQATGCYIE